MYTCITMYEGGSESSCAEIFKGIELIGMKKQFIQKKIIYKIYKIYFKIKIISFVSTSKKKSLST